LLLLVLVVYVPFLQALFNTSALSPIDWAIVTASAFTVLPVLEAAKWLGRRGWLGEMG
jgi:Ca2+-transporting ATPase